MKLLRDCLCFWLIDFLIQLNRVSTSYSELLILRLTKSSDRAPSTPATMPRYKRTLEEDAIEMANKSDSNDEDYSDHAPRSTRKSRPKARKGVSQKRRRTSAYDSDSDPLDLSNSLDEKSESEQSNVERTATGRIRRGAAKRANYAEATTSSDEDENQEEDEAESPKPAPSASRRRKPVVLKLNLGTMRKELSVPPTQAPVRRSSRARSASVKASDNSLVNPYGTRRSRRLTHDDTEDMVALSGSGRHAETVRKGTGSPEATYRTRRMASAARTTVTDAIPEEEEAEVKEEEHKQDMDQVVVQESDPVAPPEDENAADNENADDQETGDVEMAESGVIPESEQGDADEDEEEPRSGTRSRPNRKSVEAITQDAEQGDEQEAPQENEQEPQDEQPSPRRKSRRLASKAKPKQQDEGSDFAPTGDDANDDDSSDSEVSEPSPRKRSQNSDEPEESSNDRRSRLRRRPTQSRAESEAEELHEELAELKSGRTRRRREQPSIVYEEKPRRTRKSVDYRIVRPELALPLDDDDDVAEPVRRPRTGGGGWQRSLFSTYGPFGGAGGPPPLLGGPTGMGATGGVESDSSDDESGQRPRAAGQGVAATTAIGQSLGLAAQHQTHNEAAQTNLGKIKDRQALADSDPLGIDPNVNFDSVGGLQGHIDQLKEMVSLPLLYPEIFQRFHIVPPRGVLFHGPPGTGKTLLARALASSVSSEGRKVTFYMRKGADALSKWVGEAERQLRLLFEEARKNQPSIIFFDEIDGEYCPGSYLKSR